MPTGNEVQDACCAATFDISIPAHTEGCHHRTFDSPIECCSHRTAQDGTPHGTIGLYTQLFECMQTNQLINIRMRNVRAWARLPTHLADALRKVEFEERPPGTEDPLHEAQAPKAESCCLAIKIALLLVL